ncbi:SusD/RagB family nutrient-binding outer membrane lipoprotein [Pseudozobellia thermophila]|uniref:Susd and RagB outer membrane lipoprotein n=1 Tax=Pseudozobellia thermophila TaxID=192903 RepID=A0A1M6HPC9_9FLAO|nr:SusD/RagB family nutrient-binding outer membrane lipoprotein [Pseudozobellia thermophila]SHJ24065.1 Susd and RagB outer membrane lipoprotein [Pseudozobellia thermophila]
MKKLIIGVMVITALAVSCDQQLDINKDPDLLDPEGVAISSEIAAGIIGIGGAHASSISFVGGIWSQFWSQSLSSSQYRTEDNYTIGTNDYERAWSNTYDALSDIRNAKKIALERENWNYYLIATCLEAYAFQILTDFYGDIPYEEANDPSNFTPNFNTGEEVYDFMIRDLDDALGRDLEASSLPAPGSDDFVFGGNMDNWTAFANTLKLKIFLRQTEARPTVAETGIRAMLDSGAPFLTINAGIGLGGDVFEDEASLSNPLYESDRRQLNTQNNLRASTTMWSFLSANADPRLEAFYQTVDTSGDPLGPLDQGDYNSQAPPATISLADISPLSPVYFISAAQSYFMQAEAMERYNGGAGAKELYDAGVLAAFEKSPNFYDNTKSEADQTWIFSEPYDGTPFIAEGGPYEYPVAGTFDDKLKSIIVQKWISCYPDQGYESFFEQHRTGFPEISPIPQSNEAYVAGQWAYSVEGLTGGIFPQRLVYPNSEISRNSNAPAIIDITVPIWWNK